MAAAYRVLCADLVGVGNQTREELAIQDLKYSYVLDAAGSFSGWISLDDEKCTRANLDPGATAIYIERGGQLVWGGILWTAEVNTADRRLELGGEGFWSYFKKRVIKNRIGMANVTASATNTYTPDSDVTTTGVAGTPDAVNLWENLNNPTTNPAIGVITSTPGDGMIYQARANISGGDFAGLVPGSVRVVLWAASTNVRAVSVDIRVAGTTYASPPRPISIYTTMFSQTWTVNPNTNLPWTVADIEAFGSSSSIGFTTSPCITPGDTAVYQLYAEFSWGTSGTAAFRNADELAIARDIINNAQAQPGGDLDIVVGTELTTDNGGTFVGRDQTFPQYERKNTADAIEELAKLVGGFDFSIEVAWDSTGTIPQKTFKLYYPKRGRRIDGLVFNDNILGVSKVGVSVDATVMSNSVAVMGTGDGDNMLIASVADTSQLSHYPLLESVYSAKDIIDPFMLQAQAIGQLARSRSPLENPSIEKQANTWPDFGSFQLGDEALVVAQDGWISINGYQQIQQLEINVGSEGQETMVPTFVSADGTVA